MISMQKCVKKSLAFLLTLSILFSTDLFGIFGLVFSARVSAAEQYYTDDNGNKLVDYSYGLENFMDKDGRVIVDYSYTIGNKYNDYIGKLRDAGANLNSYPQRKYVKSAAAEFSATNLDYAIVDDYIGKDGVLFLGTKKEHLKFQMLFFKCFILQFWLSLHLL